MQAALLMPLLTERQQQPEPRHITCGGTARPYLVRALLTLWVLSVVPHSNGEVKVGMVVSSPTITAIANSSAAFATLGIADYVTAFQSPVNIGPSVEFGLGARASFEVAAVYKGFGLNADTGTVPSSAASLASVEVPMTLKLFWGEESGLRKYIGIGVGARYIRTRDVDPRFMTARQGLDAGPALVVGTERRLGPLTGMIQMRYTLWGVRALRDLSGLLIASPHQADVTLGVYF